MKILKLLSEHKKRKLFMICFLPLLVGTILKINDIKRMQQRAEGD